jgi:cleavage stimulation factor subunit 2
MTPTQLYEVLSQMKVLLQWNQAQARAILAANPQLSYALLMSMVSGRGVFCSSPQVMLGVIPAASLQALVQQAPASVGSSRPPPVPAPAAPHTGFSSASTGFSPANTGYAALNTGFSAAATGFSGAPTGFSPPNTGFSPANTGFSPAPTANPDTLGLGAADEQAKLLESLLALSPQQIDQLPPTQRAQVQAILALYRSAGGR